MSRSTSSSSWHHGWASEGDVCSECGKPFTKDERVMDKCDVYGDLVTWYKRCRNSYACEEYLKSRELAKEAKVSITTIPEEELQKDLQDSYADIALCKTVLELGIFEYSGGFVQVRLMSNQKIVKIILAELARREQSAKETK